MGAKDSKPSFISYEEAVKRVPDNELRRIREAFKRCSSGNGSTLSLDAFVREVLCDGVPKEVAEWLYQACGGTKKGISFKDLLCGILVLTKGSLEEKIKFLWTLYVNKQNDNGLYIHKWDFARTLHLENTSLPVTNTPRTAEILTSLFGAGDKVTYEQFRSWLLIHKNATVLSKWLLSDCNATVQDLDTPTFYQSLAGVTHLEERDIIDLEKFFWSLRSSCSTGQLDIGSLSPTLSPPLPPAAVAGVFGAFDENRDGHVDFKELCCGLSAACRGPRAERLKFCFKIFDLDRDGVLNKKELIQMVGILSEVANESLRNQQSRASTPDDARTDTPDKTFDTEAILFNLKEKLTNVPTKPMFQLGPTDSKTNAQSPPMLEDTGVIADDMALTQEDFLIWSVESAESLVTPFLDLIFEVCHIVLGLRPQCKHQERDIVLGWLHRSVQRGYSVGQFWYLISAEWWASWTAYTAGAGPCCRHARLVDDAIVCDDSFTSNSTESMGSLLYRAETASVGSGSSSGVSSGGARVASRPRPPDNCALREPQQDKVRTLTGEGGLLRRDITLAQHRDFELLPEALWRAIALWYGAVWPLPRQVIRPPNSDVELELYPLHLKILRHVATTPRMNTLSGVGAVSMYSSVPLAPAPPERQLAYTAAFSRLATVKQVSEFLCSALGLTREDMRLWTVDKTGACVLLDSEVARLCELQLDETVRLLLEVRNQDLTWPEEIGALSMSSASGSHATSAGWSSSRRNTIMSVELPGATGLHNLGNTCFMNAALQAVWNTGPLTSYFNSGTHQYEVNTTNPLGTKGALALRFGELCKEVWSSQARSIAPLRVRWCVSRWARGLAGGGQQDAQELLAWLLDTLHEELNRVTQPPPPPTTPPPREVDGPRGDQVLATEAWEQHLARNQSIISELFYGQLKSKVRCDACGHESVRFETFNMLSLPLPMEAAQRATVKVILLDGSVPVMYGVRVGSDATYADVKSKLSELCALPPDEMLLVELNGATISRTFSDASRVLPATLTSLHAYQTPERVDCAVPLCHQEAAAAPDAGDAPPSSRSEVSGARPNSASLCMPALFCFKRSRSEILMSQSPPALYGPAAGEDRSDGARSSTLPRDLARRTADRQGSPTLSVRSLTAGASPRLPRVKFGSSPSDMHRLSAPEPPQSVHYLVAVHRKQTRLDAYFLSSQRSRPALFGVPILVGLYDGMTGRELYAAVWTQVARLLSARPSTEHSNHATDCDDSLGYEFPFRLRCVLGSGAWCALCAWPALCRGCALPSDLAPLVQRDSAGTSPWLKRQRSLSPADCVPDSSSPIAKAKFNRQFSARDSIDISAVTSSREVSRLELSRLPAGAMLAIDWDPTALHLRYQSTREKACVEHSSVAECEQEASRPISLAHCMSSFTRCERLEERYHCAGCRSAQPATKKLQIWRLPPVMIIHLKRFQYVNHKWIKSQKVVNFPFQDFDPTEYLASVPQETILRHRDICSRRRPSLFHNCDNDISESDSDTDTADRGSDEEKEKRGTEELTEERKKRFEDDIEDRRRNSSVVLRDGNLKTKIERKRRESVERAVRTRQRLESTSLAATPVTDDNLEDYHQHKLTADQDPFDLKYRLYAVVSHSGQMSGGHYVAYCRHPSGAWLCYNDSMCRELSSPPQIHPSHAYLLFYERRGLHNERYLPDVAGKQPIDESTLDFGDADLNKNCVIA